MTYLRLAGIVLAAAAAGMTIYAESAAGGVPCNQGTPVCNDSAASSTSQNAGLSADHWQHS